jgi:1,4-dihydroxy-2-naphthoate octaprenyltransferase
MNLKQVASIVLAFIPIVGGISFAYSSAPALGFGSLLIALAGLALILVKVKE